MGKVVGEMRFETRLKWPGVEAADHRHFVHLFRLSSTALITSVDCWNIRCE